MLHPLVVAAPDTLRGRLRGLTTARLVRTCGRLRQQAAWDAQTAATAASLRALARRSQLRTTEIPARTLRCHRDLRDASKDGKAAPRDAMPRRRFTVCRSSTLARAWPASPTRSLPAKSLLEPPLRSPHRIN